MKKRFSAVSAVIALGLFLLLLSLRQNNSVQENAVTATGYKLNTYVTVTIYDSDNEALADECLALCDKYELIFSRTNPESELYLLNHGLLPRSEDGYYTVSEDLYHAIEIGKKYSDLSDNAFSIALEPLTSLWNFTDGTDSIPAKSKLDSALPLVNSEDVLLRAPNQIAFLKHGMGIDLGAIAKGYIADRLKEYLLSQNVNSALIYLGGNVLCIGQKGNAPFRIGIEKPFDADGEAAAILKIADTSVVTSGTYQRCFEQDGVLYHHILDSRTGYPYQNGLSAVTIITDSSTDADALSTTCFSLGLEDGLKLLESLENADGFFITEDGEYYYTEGFLKKYDVARIP